MKIKVSEATNIQLDWLVAKARGIEVKQGASGVLYRIDADISNVYSPTQYWAQGGPIIEREIVELIRCGSSDHGVMSRFFEAVCGMEDEPGHYRMTGPTLLIAAMRAYVASKLGNEVEVPDELI